MTSPVNTDWFAPRYVIKIAGTRVKADITEFIEAVEYEEADEVASKITLTVNNPGFVFAGFKGFAEGNEVDLWIGYVGRKLWFCNRGVIVVPKPTFPRQGVPKITVVAHGAENKLFKADEKGRVFRKMTDSDIVTKIFGEVSVGTFAFDTKRKITRWKKKGTSNWDFVQRLARLNGFEISVRYDPTEGLHKAYFGPPEQEGSGEFPKYKFVYGSGDTDATLLEFFPDLNLPSQTTKVQVAFTDPKNRKTHRLVAEIKKKDAEKTQYKGASGKKKLRRKVKNGPAVKLTVFGQTEEVIADRPFRTCAEAKRFAAAWFARRQKDFVFGRGVVLGVPSLRRRQVHELELPERRFNGDWIITSVHQRLGSSGLYETSFTAVKKVLGSAVGSVGNLSGTKLEPSDL